MHEANNSNISLGYNETFSPSQNFENKPDLSHEIAVSNVHVKDKNKCENCNEMINQSSIKKHVKNCKIYSKFSKITSTGFECLVCYEGHYTKRKDMNFHIREVHSDLYQEELVKIEN